MKTITPNDAEFNKIVQILDDKNYDVDTNHLDEDCSLVCPADPDMEIIKSNGQIHLKKKRILGFLKSFTKIT